MTKNKIYNAAVQYIDNNYSPAEKEFQHDMIIAVMKAFIAGAKIVIEENMCLNCKASKDCNKSVKDECINFLLNIK